MTPEEKTLCDEFRKKFQEILFADGTMGVKLHDELKDFLLSTHRTAREEGRREGRREARKKV